MKDRITFHHGDSRDMIRFMPANIGLVLTDPPYGMNFVSNFWGSKGYSIAGDESLEGALQLFYAVASQVLEIAERDDLPFLIWTGWKQEGAWVRMLTEELGLQVRSSIIWVKNNHSMGDLDGSFAPKHERIIYATRGRPKVAPRLTDVQEGSIIHKTNHPTPKPVNLLGKLIRSCTEPGDIVVDPFMGSGSTMIAAHRTGRKFWGCEIEEQWIGELVRVAGEITSELFAPTEWE